MEVTASGPESAPLVMVAGSAPMPPPLPIPFATPSPEFVAPLIPLVTLLVGRCFSGQRVVEATEAFARTATGSFATGLIAVAFSRLKAPDTATAVTRGPPARPAVSYRAPSGPSLHATADIVREASPYAAKTLARTATTGTIEVEEAKEAVSDQPATAAAVAATSATVDHDERGVMFLLSPFLESQAGALTRSSMAS